MPQTPQHPVSAAEILHRHPHVLLDFDGPVCSVFGSLSDRTVADRLRELLGGNLPADIAATNDPFGVLTYSATRGTDVQGQIEGELCRLEVAAVADAPDTPGAEGVLQHLTANGHTVTIVSNNSASAVNTYLRSRRLTDYIHGVSAREPARPLLLKPHPHLLREAMTTLDAQPAECIMIGDSLSDIQAAYRAGTAVIALTDKRDRFKPHHPSATIDDMHELIDAGRAP